LKQEASTRVITFKEDPALVKQVVGYLYTLNNQVNTHALTSDNCSPGDHHLTLRLGTFDHINKPDLSILGTIAIINQKKGAAADSFHLLRVVLPRSRA
jgi:hypothetical protein